MLHLRTWGDGGCPLTHFSLSFRRPSGNWIQVPGTFEPSQDYLLSELLPGTEYVVKVNAHNSAGVTTQDYIFTTLLPHGGEIEKFKKIGKKKFPQFWAFCFF